MPKLCTVRAYCFAALAWGSCVFLRAFFLLIGRSCDTKCFKIIYSFICRKFLPKVEERKPKNCIVAVPSYTVNCLKPRLLCEMRDYWLCWCYSALLCSLFHVSTPQKKQSFCWLGTSWTVRLIASSPDNKESGWVQNTNSPVTIIQHRTTTFLWF